MLRRSLTIQRISKDKLIVLLAFFPQGGLQLRAIDAPILICVSQVKDPFFTLRNLITRKLAVTIAVILKQPINHATYTCSLCRTFLLKPAPLVPLRTATIRWSATVSLKILGRSAPVSLKILGGSAPAPLKILGWPAPVAVSCVGGCPFARRYVPIPILVESPEYRRSVRDLFAREAAVLIGIQGPHQWWQPMPMSLARISPLGTPI